MGALRPVAELEGALMHRHCRIFVDRQGDDYLAIALVYDGKHWFPHTTGP